MVGFNRLAGLVDGPGPDFGDREPAASVEPQGVEVVVGGDEPEARRRHLLDDRLDQAGADTSAPGHHFQVCDLDVTAVFEWSDTWCTHEHPA